MEYGTLRVATPDGQVREHVIDSPSVFVGRADTNRIVIDHPSISRRHARLTIESGRLMVEDLGSANGTYVGGARLAANQAALAEPGQTIQFGDAGAVFTPLASVSSPRPVVAPPGAPSPAPQATAPTPSTHQAVGLTLTGPSGPVAPGAATAATVLVQNRGTTVDELSISVGGIPPEWVRVSRPQVSLLPGAREDVTITIEPPRATGVRAGEHEFWVAVTSRQHGAEVRALGKLSVLPFGGLEARLEPVRAERHFRLVLENRGNSLLDLRLGAVDDEDALDFSFPAASVQVPAGEARALPFQSSLKSRKLFGPPSVHPFRVEATPTGQAPGSQKAVVNGQLMRKPPLEPWKRPALLVLLVAALVGGGFGYTRVCESGWPLCPGGDDASVPASGGDATPGAGSSPSPGGQQGGSVGTPLPSPSPGGSPPSSPAPGETAPPASPSTAGSATKPPSVGPPKIDWIVADHAGTGLVSLRIATDIPSSATVSVYRPASIGRGTSVPVPPPESSEKPGTLHTISMPTYSFPAGFNVQVQSEDGRQAYAAIENGESISGYWAASGKEPTLSFSSGFKATANWTVRVSADLKLEKMEVLLFSKKAGCSVADQCLGELVKTFSAGSKPAVDGRQTFAASITFPDNKHDYQLVLASRGTVTGGDRKGAALLQLFQIAVSGSQLK